MFICFFTYMLFLLWGTFVERNNVTTLLGTETEFDVRFVSPVRLDGDRASALVRFRQETVQLAYRLRTEEEKERWKQIEIGTRCSFSGTLQRPMKATNPYGFDYADYLRRQRVHWIVRPTSLSFSSCAPSKQTFIERLYTIRQRGIRYIEQHAFGEASAFMQALIYGEREGIDPNILADYQKLGLIHLLAISGLHMTLLAGGCFYVFIRLGLTRERAKMVLLVLVPTYALIAGGAPSVVRAAVMTVCFLLLPARMRSIDALSVACLFLLAINPYNVFHVGFQLSFLVCFSFLICSSFLTKQRSVIHQLLMTSFVAQIGIVPLLLYYFYEVSLISIPLNVLFVPFYSFLVLPLSFITLCAYVINERIGSYIASLLSFLLRHSHDVVTTLADVSLLTLTLGRPSPWLIVAYVFAVALFFLSFEHQRFRLLFRLSVVIVFAVHYIVPFLRPSGEVVMLDVGQGDCIYIELPYRKAVYLIDTGGTIQFADEEWKKRRRSFSVGEHVVVPFLKAKGVRTIDRLIATHGDYDHIGDASTVLSSVHVRELLVSNRTGNDVEKRLLSVAHKHRTRIRVVKEGERWSEASASFFVLSPQGDEERSNDRSVVLYAQMGGAKWLFTGDLEEKGEERLIQKYGNLRVDILKVGHHGSRTSTSERFLAHVQPKLALISVGRGNRYSHPHEEVIERLRKRRVRTFRTDEHGAIVVRYRERISTIVTFPP